MQIMHLDQLRRLNLTQSTEKGRLCRKKIINPNWNIYKSNSFTKYVNLDSKNNPKHAYTPTVCFFQQLKYTSAVQKIHTLHPIARRIWRETIMAIIAQAAGLLSEWITGQKVRTRTEPDNPIASMIRSHCSHGIGISHRTCEGRWQWIIVKFLRLPWKRIHLPPPQMAIPCKNIFYREKW